MILRQELEADFLILADADAAAEAGRGGVRPIVASRTQSRYGARIIHKYVPRNHRIAFAHLEEMQDVDLIELSPLDNQRVRIRITADGHAHAAALRKRGARDGGESEQP